MSIPLSVIIVNYKPSSLLLRCLESLEFDQSQPLETWVVDNGSEESLDALRSRFPTVHWILNPQNLGFAKAVNQGLRVAAGRYFLLLNPDTEIESGAVQRMAEFLDAHP